MEHRWQTKRFDGEHLGEWVDAEPPVDKKVLDLAAQIIELEQRVKYEEDERGKFIDAIWKATGAKGDYDYPGQVIREVEALSQRPNSYEELDIWKALTPEQRNFLSAAQNDYGTSVLAHDERQLRLVREMKEIGLLKETYDQHHYFFFISIKGRKVLSSRRFDSADK